MMASADKMNLVVRAKKQGIPVAQMVPWPVLLRISGARVELLVERVEAFCAVEDEHRRGRWTGDVHVEVDDDNVAVRVGGAVEDVLGPVRSVDGERERKTHSRTMPRRWR